MRRATPTTFALVLTLLLAGCGGTSGDLMAIEVEGGEGRGRPLDIVVANDGRGTCNGGAEKPIPSDVVIEARELERELADLAEEGATYGPAGEDQREYVVRMKAGSVRWGEGEAGLPEVLPRAQLLTVKLDRLLCR